LFGQCGNRAIMKTAPVIARATLADASVIAEIYAHHVLHGTATFEFVPPDVDEISARISKIQGSGWPWLVARDAAGEIVGYAYVGQMAPRPAYRFACETSIYLRPDMLGRGIGGALLAALLAAAEAAGFRQAVALISGDHPASVALHAKAGFVRAGQVKSVGRKQGQWLDLLYMQRPLGPGDTAAPDAEPD
jgi:L-amino acid N-acyltransferase YncA